ncbi:cytochrome P450 [Sporodiniella umbellata]|nr:cytochrome P450 [Sporodiniella umbellata]
MNSVIIESIYVHWQPLFLVFLLAYIALYSQRRYFSTLANAPLAPARHFVTKYFGLVSPPNQHELTDKLSEFLIHVGQDSRFFPVSVCWSITGKPLVIVSTIKGIKDVLLYGQMKSKIKGEPSKVQRGNLICLIHNLVFGGKSINNVVGEDWRWRRHVLLPPFQPKQLVPTLLPYVARRTADLMNLFERYAEDQKPAELDGLFMDTTMDVINYFLYGRHDLNYDMVGGRTNMKAWLPFGLNKTSWAQKNYGPSRDLLKAFVEDSLRHAQEDYKNDTKQFDKDNVPEKKRSYRSVAACAFASGRYKHKPDLVNDMLALTFAGHDTTAHTLAFAFSELAKSPKIQQALFEQVRQVLGPPPICPENITADVLSRMPLVTAIYRETLRKYPAVVFIPVHVNRDIEVDGAIVPAGAEIWCNVRGVQMNPEIFPNPDTFDPWRWIEPEQNLEEEGKQKEALVNGSYTTDHFTPETQYKFPDISFTLGQHSCLGKNMAVLELRTVIACTVNQFTFKLREGCHIDTQIVLTTKPRNGVWVHFTKRSE